jgi:hypothetical protein
VGVVCQHSRVSVTDIDIIVKKLQESEDVGVLPFSESR